MPGHPAPRDADCYGVVGDGATAKPLIRRRQHRELRELRDTPVIRDGDIGAWAGTGAARWHLAEARTPALQPLGDSSAPGSRSSQTIRYMRIVVRRDPAMQTAKGKVVEGGRIIVPAAFRRALGLEKGDSVLLELHDEELRVRPARTALRRLQAKLRALPSAYALASDETRGRSAAVKPSGRRRVARARPRMRRGVVHGRPRRARPPSRATTVPDMAHVLDASALLCLLFEEPGHERVEAALGSACIAAANLAEVVGKLIDRGLPPEGGGGRPARGRPRGGSHGPGAGRGRGRAASRPPGRRACRSATAPASP